MYSASAAPSSSAAGPSSSGGRAAHGVVPLWPRPLLARGILAARIYITVSVLVSLVLSLLPLAWARYASDRLYFTMLLVAAATHLADVIGRYGMPNTSQAYIARVSADSSFHLIFLPVILYIAGVPYFSGEVAAIDFDVLHVGEWLHSSVGARGEQQQQQQRGQRRRQSQFPVMTYIIVGCTGHTCSAASDEAAV